MLADAGLTVTEATGTIVTMMAAVPLLPSLVAVIVAEPAATAETRPVALTDATAVLLLDQVRTRPVSVLPAESLVAADSGCVKLISFWRQIRGRSHGVGIGRRGQKTGEGIGERISWMDIMLAAGGRNENGGICGASPERVEPVGIHSKNRGIAVEAQFRSPLEGMGAARVGHVLFELVDASIRTEDGSIRGIETLK